MQLNDVLNSLNPIEPSHQYRDKVCIYVPIKKTILSPPINITGFTSGRGFIFSLPRSYYNVSSIYTFVV